MGGSVEIPVWLVVVIGVLATLGLIDRMLVPTARWFFRQRAIRAFDDLNTRLQLRIQPFKLTRRQSLVDRLIYDQEVVKAAEAAAAEKGEPRAIAMSRVETYAREIVPHFSAFTYFRVGTAAARWLSRLLYRVRLGYLDEEGLRAVDPDASVVFVINHRSNMDYVLVTYMAASTSALSYAVGEWARVWLLQSLIRAMGAYFIRRDSGDALYRKVLARYVQLATAEGVTQAVFPEGGLTRDGSLRPARLGLISYMVARFDPKAERDIVFIPVGINYDRVIEDRNLTARIARDAGTPHARWGTGAVMRYVAHALRLKLSGRWYRYGYAAVSFGHPVSLRAYCARRGIDFRGLGEQQRFAETESLGRLLMAEIGKVVPVLPVSLVATVFRQAGATPLSEFDIKTRCADLIEDLRARGAHIHIPRTDLDYAVSAGLRMLTLRHLVTEADGLFAANGREAVILGYYANSIAHYLTEWPDSGSPGADI